MEFSDAVDIFAQGFAASRSFTHSYICDGEGCFRVLRDAPRTGGEARSSEVVIYDSEPEEVRRRIDLIDDPKFAISVISRRGDDLDRTRDLWKAEGYRLARREEFFAIRTASAALPPRPILRIDTPELAARLNQAAIRRQILPEHLESSDPPVRLYGATEIEDDPESPFVGWVKSVRATARGNWVANLYVHPDHRRRGIGSALMLEMLQDDAAHGVPYSVLLASKSGARLYPKLGYERLGTLQLFTRAMKRR